MKQSASVKACDQALHCSRSCVGMPPEFGGSWLERLTWTWSKHFQTWQATSTSTEPVAARKEEDIYKGLESQYHEPSRAFACSMGKLETGRISCPEFSQLPSNQVACFKKLIIKASYYIYIEDVGIFIAYIILHTKQFLFFGRMIGHQVSGWLHRLLVYAFWPFALCWCGSRAMRRDT